MPRALRVNEEQTFQCDKCNKAFNDINTRNRHWPKCKSRGNKVVQSIIDDKFENLEQIAKAANKFVTATCSNHTQTTHFPNTDEWNPDVVGDTGSLIPTAPKDRHHNISVHLPTIEELERQQRAKPQKETLGYRNQLLRSTKSLSQKAKEIVQQDRNRKSKFPPNARISKRSSLTTTPNGGREADMTPMNTDDHDEGNILLQQGNHVHENQVEHKHNDVYDPTGDLPWVINDDCEGDDISVEDVTPDSYDVDLEDCLRRSKGKPFSRNIDMTNNKVHKPFHYKPNTLPPLYVAYIDLLKTLDQHVVDLAVFDEIIDWAIRYSTQHPGIFENAGRDNITKRKAFINHLRKNFEREDVMPTVTDITLPHSKRVVSVPAFDFGSQVADLLLSIDHTAIKQPNMDSFTWGQVKPIPECKLIRPLLNGVEVAASEETAASGVKRMKPPDLNSLLGQSLRFLIEHIENDNKKNLVPCEGKVMKIVNKQLKKVAIKWKEGDDPNDYWKMIVSRARWKSHEHGGWCLSSDDWFNDHPDQNDEDKNDDNDLKKPPHPGLDNLLDKRVKVSCRMEIVDSKTLKGSGDTHLGWYSGLITEVVNNESGEVMIKWCGYRNRQAEKVSLTQSLWYATRSKEGAWRVVEDHDDDSDLLNPRTGYTDDSVLVDDLYSGSAMTQGLNTHLRGVAKPDGIDVVRPLPILLFIDKSHTDLFGTLSAIPVVGTIASLPLHMRMDSSNWILFGYCPNLAIGKGKNAGKLDLQSYKLNRSRRSPGDKKIPEAMGKVIDYHHILDHIFKSFDKCARKGLVIHHEKQNVRALYIPFIHLVIGDTSGNNELMCHFNSSSCLDTPCLNYGCMCGGMDLTTTPPRCVPITREDIELSLSDSDFARSISQHQVRSAFHNLPMAMRDGLQVLSPKEVLHVFYVGLYMGAILAIHDLIGKKSKNAKHKDYMDQLHQHVALELRRQSERDIPRSSNRYGFMDMTRLTGRERLGNLFVCLVLLHTRQGKMLMKPFLDRAEILHTDFVDTIELLLSYEAWISSSGNKRSDVAGSLPVVCELAEMILKYLPRKMVKKKKKSPNVSRVKEEIKEEIGDNNNSTNSPPRKKQCKEKSDGTNTNAEKKKKKSPNSTTTALKKKKKSPTSTTPAEKKKKKSPNVSHVKEEVGIEATENNEDGSNGWVTVKFHALFQFPDAMLKFGSGRVFDSGPGEEHHKEFIKAPAHNTSRNKTTFTNELTVRKKERDIVRRCADEVKEEMISPLSRSKTKTNQVRVSGMYTLFVSKSNDGDNNYSCQTYWHDHKKRVNKDDFILHHLLTYAIISHAQSHHFDDEVTVTGFTEAHFNSTTEHEGDFIVRASPCYLGEEWHDWAIISIPKCEEESRKSFKRPPGVAYYCFARILGFISYEKSPGYPTYFHHDIKKRPIQSIYNEQLVDSGMYVVVECNEDRVDMDQIGQQMVFPFKMSHDLNKLRIFPITAIVSPLAVVTNWRSKSSVHYLACMPRRKWRHVFNNRVREKMSYMQDNELEDLIQAPEGELYSSSEEESDEEDTNANEIEEESRGGDREDQDEDDSDSMNELEIEDTSDEEDSLSDEG